MSTYILIAEDDPFLSDTMAEALEENGVKVKTANNGAKAIDYIDQEQPALLMLDLLMPKIDGHEVLKHIAKKNYKFPTIILSNLSDAVNKAACEKAGVVDYLLKSKLSEEDLWPAVQKHLPENK